MNTVAELLSGSLRSAPRVTISEGLTELPKELLLSASTLEELDLSGNQLSTLPSWLDQFEKLKIIFLSRNQFSTFPEVLGRCESLSMVGFKSNQIRNISDISLPKELRWLILTDNKLSSLPESIGRCRQLQKLMLAGNELTKLPESIGDLQNLELVRLSANKLESIPNAMFDLPRLAWVALAGNPISGVRQSDASNGAGVMLAGRVIAWDKLQIKNELGRGASGITYRAKFTGIDQGPSDIAVKIFNGSVTSDGRPQDELMASLLCGQHPNLLTAIAHIAGDSQGRDAVSLPLVGPEYAPLAAPPNYQTCSRDVYPAHLKLSVSAKDRILTCVENAIDHLHHQGITHGDLYAHNILVNDAGAALLGDFGAATCFTDPNSELAVKMKQLEKRALGYLRAELEGLSQT